MTGAENIQSKRKKTFLKLNYLKDHHRKEQVTVLDNEKMQYLNIIS